MTPDVIALVIVAAILIDRLADKIAANAKDKRRVKAGAK